MFEGDPEDTLAGKFPLMLMVCFMTCSKGYMGECGIRCGYAEVVNMDPGEVAMLQKSISAKLCPTVIGQACMDMVVNPHKPGDPSHASWSGEVANTLDGFKKPVISVEETTAPFRELIAKGAIFSWDKRREGAYQTLMRMMSSEATLRPYIQGLPT